MLSAARPFEANLWAAVLAVVMAAPAMSRDFWGPLGTIARVALGSFWAVSVVFASVVFAVGADTVPTRAMAGGIIVFWALVIGFAAAFSSGDSSQRPGRSATGDRTPKKNAFA